jgi:hypothetical protein
VVIKLGADRLFTITDLLGNVLFNQELPGSIVFRNIETVVRKEISKRQQLPAPVQLFFSRLFSVLANPNK